MRIPILLVSFACLALPLVAQVPDPGASQDEEAGRQKILKAADQIDLLEGNAEATRTAVDAMKADVAKLRDENTALKLQVSSLQDAVQKMEDDRAKYRQEIEAANEKERQVLIDEVSRLVASKGSVSAKTVAKKKAEPEPEAESKPEPKSTEVHASHDSLAPPPDTATTGPTNPIENAGVADSSSGAASHDAAADPAPAAVVTPPPRKHKAYEHIVAPHETLTMICNAFRDQGVKVTVAQIRKANGMTEKSTLKVGQKLFIPKPGD